MRSIGTWSVLVVGLLTAAVAHADEPVHVKLLAPEKDSHVGIGGAGWIVDLRADFQTPLESTGFTAPQLTGPGAHNNVPPFPGAFSPGRDDRFPGLVVLVSTAGIGARSCQNVANLFNLTGLNDRSDYSVQLWDTWIIGGPNFGLGVESTVLAAVAADLNGNGVYDDAPAVLPDADGDGVCDENDLEAFGVASNIARTTFFINP